MRWCPLLREAPAFHPFLKNAFSPLSGIPIAGFRTSYCFFWLFCHISFCPSSYISCTISSHFIF